jgi:pilus assembly protein Flp/PilA
MRTPDPNAKGPETMFTFEKSAMTETLRRFLRDESGATAIEYAMIASGVGVAIASTIVALGSGVKNNLYGNVAAALK